MEKKKLNILKGVVGNLLDMQGYRNPLDGSSISEEDLLKVNFKINLLTGKFDFPREDTFFDIYSMKSKWFCEFLKEKEFE